MTQILKRLAGTAIATASLSLSFLIFSSGSAKAESLTISATSPNGTVTACVDLTTMCAEPEAVAAASLDDASASNNTVNVSPAVCANIASSGNCSATSTTTTNNTASSSEGTLSIGNNTTNLTPAICANVLSDGDCTATSTTDTTNSITPTTGGPLLVSNNTVNVSPAICLNVLSNGSCAATVTTTTTNNPPGVTPHPTPIGTPLHGSVLGAAFGGKGSLPRTGGLLLLELLASALLATFAGIKSYLSQRAA
jgi:hypothetical protein